MHSRYSTLIRLGIGAALALMVVRMVIELASSRQMSSLEELYPPPRDPYLDDLFKTIDGFSQSISSHPHFIIGGRVYP